MINSIVPAVCGKCPRSLRQTSREVVDHGAPHPASGRADARHDQRVHARGGHHRGPHAPVAARGAAGPVSRGGPGQRPRAPCWPRGPGAARCRPRAACGRPWPARCPRPHSGPKVSVEVADPATGRVLLSEDGTRLLTPASTTKLVTSAAALAVLGPDATFTTRVVSGATPDSVILVGGGDPTLAVHPFPAQDYPRPATLASLAAETARALKAEGRRTVSVGYDTSLYTGPDLAPRLARNLRQHGRRHPDLRPGGGPGAADHGRCPRRLRRPVQPAGADHRSGGHGGRLVRRPAGRGRHPRHRDPRWRRPPPRTPPASPACPRRRCRPWCRRCSRRATT